ncbi:MAG: hypothetical protein ABIW49_02705 [Knoellia sp.]
MSFSEQPAPQPNALPEQPSTISSPVAEESQPATVAAAAPVEIVSRGVL